MNGKQKATGFLLGGLTIALFTPHVLPSIQAKEASSEWQSAASTQSETIESETQETTSSFESSSSASSDSSKESTTEPKESVTAQPSSTSESKVDKTHESSVKEEGKSEQTKDQGKETKKEEQIEKQEEKKKEKKEETPKEEEKTLPAVVEKEQIEENYEFSVVKNQTTSEFIQAIGKDAQVIAWKNDLYASIMIAQAILETGSGNSQLSRAPYYNLFGIKGSYQGQSVNFSTAEDNGSGSLYTIKSNFRKYPSYKESLEDYADLLTGGISGNATFYQQTWKKYAKTYKDATAFLTGRYATDTSYDKKLNALIEAYTLTAFDHPADETAEESTSNGAVTEQTKEDTDNSKEASAKSIASVTVAEEQETETLFHREWPVAVKDKQKWSAWSSAQQQAEQIDGNQFVLEGDVHE